MTERNKTLRSKQSGNNDTPDSTHLASPRSVKWLSVLLLLFGSLTAGLSSGVQADPSTDFTANRVYAACTFTTGSRSTSGTLNSVLSINGGDLATLQGGDIQASYILIYVRENPNEGQDLRNSTSFTGPILCVNRNEVVSPPTPTTEATPIPGPVDVVGSEESSNLQYQESSTTDPNPNPKKKRVCHTVASITDCFTIEKKP